MTRESKTAKTAFLVMIITFISKVLGFGREVMLGSTYGASFITDAYLISITIPTILFATITGAVTTTYIPVYSSIIKEQGKLEAIRFTNKILNIILIISVLLSIFGIIFIKPIVSMIAYGFDNRTLDLAINFSRVTFPMIIFIGIAYIFMAFLQSNNDFLAPAGINIPNNIIIIIVLIFSNFFGVKGLIYATVLGAILQFVIQYPSIKKKGFFYQFIIDFNDKNVKKVGKLSIPVVIGIAVYQVNTLIDRMLASGLAEGSISALNFANKLNGFVFGVFSLSISTVIYPVLSSLKAENNKQQFKSTLISSINLITFIMLPITIGAIILRDPIVSILFERGEFDSRATLMTSSALLYYSIGMVFFGYRDVLNRVFYALHDTKTPMINGSLAVIGNIILNIILVKFMQHSGLALATSITAMITTILLFYSLKNKVGSIEGNKIFIVFVKCLISSIIMGVCVYLINKYLHNVFLVTSDLLKLSLLILDIGVGSLIYIIFCYILGINEVNFIIKLIKNKKISKSTLN